MPKPPPPPAKNSKASIRSLWASRQAANPSIRAGNTSGGAKNFGSTSTNTRITLCLLFSLPLPAGIMPPDGGHRIPQVSQIARGEEEGPGHPEGYPGPLGAYLSSAHRRHG